jgi:hypothetical protein
MPIPTGIRDWLTKRRQRRLEQTFAEAREREEHADERGPGAWPFTRPPTRRASRPCRTGGSPATSWVRARLGGGTVEGHPEAADAVSAGFLFHGALSTYEKLDSSVTGRSASTAGS